MSVVNESAVPVELGYPKMDFDHEVLGSILKRLTSAIASNDFADLGFINIRLMAYVDAHFALEESLMDSSGFPGAAEHKMQHAEMQRHMERLAELIRSAEFDVVPSGLLMLRDWLLFHVDGLDRLLANHLKAWEAGGELSSQADIESSDAGLQDPRRSPRYERASLVKISSPNTLESLIGVVENVSEGGLCVSVPKRYMVGEAVTVVSSKGLQEAVVRHCRVREQDACFAIGLEYAL